MVFIIKEFHYIMYNLIIKLNFNYFSSNVKDLTVPLPLTAQPVINSHLRPAEARLPFIMVA